MMSFIKKWLLKRAWKKEAEEYASFTQEERLDSWRLVGTGYLKTWPRHHSGNKE